MDEVQIIRQYINDQVSSGAKREDVIEDLRQNKDPRIQYFIKDYLGDTDKQKEEPGLGQLGAETAAAAVVGKKILDMFGKGSVEPPSPPPGGGAVGVAPIAPTTASVPAASPIPPASNVGQQMQGLDWEKLPQWQKDVLLSGYKAELDKQNAQSFEATRMAKQKEAIAAINQSPAAAQAVQQTVAPTIAQTAQQTAPAITEAAQAPATSIPPAEKNKGGAPTKEKREAAPFYLNKEEIRKAQGEQNSYLNMLGYDKKNPDSPRSQAAKVSFELFLNEGLEGKVQRGVSGKPVSHESVYKPWLEKNFQFLPEQTQVFLLEQQQKATKRGVIPPVPLPVGAAVPPSSGGGGGGAFTTKPTTPGGFLHNLNPMRLE